MKNVLLVGDSIRLGYQKKLAKYLGPNVTIYAPEENSRFAKYALWGVYYWMEKFGNPKIDVGQFNAGIWDLHRATADGQIFTPIDEYARDMRRLALQMQYYSEKTIFANTIPAGKALDKRPELDALINSSSNAVKLSLVAPQDEWNRDIAAYNQKAESIMAELGIPVNDFYSAIFADTEKYIAGDGIHLTEEGYELLAQKTAEKILGLL